MGVFYYNCAQCERPFSDARDDMVDFAYGDLYEFFCCSKCRDEFLKAYTAEDLEEYDIAVIVRENGDKKTYTNTIHAGLKAFKLWWEKNKTDKPFDVCLLGGRNLSKDGPTYKGITGSNLRDPFEQMEDSLKEEIEKELKSYLISSDELAVGCYSESLWPGDKSFNDVESFYEAYKKHDVNALLGSEWWLYSNPELRPLTESEIRKKIEDFKKTIHEYEKEIEELEASLPAKRQRVK